MLYVYLLQKHCTLISSLSFSLLVYNHFGVCHKWLYIVKLKAFVFVDIASAEGPQETHTAEEALTQMNGQSEKY